MSRGVFAILRAVRDQGGKVQKCETRWDQEQHGRVLELRVYWPGDTGYDLSAPAPIPPLSEETT